MASLQTDCTSSGWLARRDLQAFPMSESDHDTEFASDLRFY